MVEMIDAGATRRAVCVAIDSIGAGTVEPAEGGGSALREGASQRIIASRLCVIGIVDEVVAGGGFHK